MKIKVLMASLFFLSSSLFAQDLLTGFTYTIAVPTGDTKNFIDQTSFKGLRLDLRKFLSHYTSVGFLAGWSAFEKTIPEQRSDEGFQTTQDMLINAFPVMVIAHYYLGEGREFRPFIGIGVGGLYVFQSKEVESGTQESSVWHFGIAPETGFAYLLGSVYALINVRYNYGFSAQNQITGKSTAQSYFAFNIGLAFTPLTYF